MAETLKGKAAKWGVNGVSCTGVIISSTTGKIQSLDLTRDSEIAQLENESGECEGESFYNAKKVINITVIPIDGTAGNSLAVVNTNSDAMIPAPGTTVTVTDTKSTVTDGTHTGKYNLISAKRGQTSKGYETIEMQIRQYDANDVTTVVNA